jgi:hypothetical protein
MVKVITAGGLGDAAMALAKIHGKPELVSELSDLEITHVRMRDDSLYGAISDFYSSQGIQNKVIRLDVDVNLSHGHRISKMVEWKVENKNNFIYSIGTGWSDNQYADEDCWEINPFPDIKYTKRNDVSVVINPSSGGTDAVKKEFSNSEIKKFVEKYPESIIIGRGNNVELESVGNSLYNKTSMQELIDIIASSQIVISPEGFVAYLGAMCGKKVLVKNQNLPAIEKRKHPDWDFSLINSMDNVTLGGVGV